MYTVSIKYFHVSNRYRLDHTNYYWKIFSACGIILNRFQYKQSDANINKYIIILIK